ncbi:copia protein [Tanacetum coccineum]
MGESSILIKLHAYLEQHELYANEVRIMCERNQDPLPYVENQQMTPPHFNPYQSSYNNPQLQQQFSPSQYGSIQHNQHYSSTYPLQPQFYHSPIPPLHTYQSQMNHQTLYVPQEIPQVAYQSPPSPTQPMISTILSIWFCCSCVFLPGEDQFACLNKTMAFLTDVASSRFPSTNNQLKTFSNPRNQATIQDGRVIVQQVQGRQGQNILVLRIRAMLLAQGEILQVDMQELLNATTAKVKDIWIGNALSLSDQGMQRGSRYFIFRTCDDLSTTQAVLMPTFPSIVSDLSQKFFKKESKEKENKYMENEIDLEKKIKELDNIICKVGQSAQTVHMLTKPQAFYDNTHKQALVDVPSKLPKVSLVNASLKKLKFHLTQFDSVVKKRTIPNALEEVEIQEYFEINDLKARLQDKDKTICKFKDTIKSLRENTKEENVNHEKYDLEPINKELENSVAKLLFENERLCNEINHVKPGSTLYKFQDACPNAITPSPKKVAITPVNNVKKVRFAEPLTSSSNIKQICLGVDLEPDEWIKDSGCSKHMMGNRKLFSTYKAYNGGNVIFGSNLRGNIIGKEPKNVNEALGDESWIVAMQEELNQFIANDVWELVPQPKNMTIIGTKWVFRNKLDENGIVSRNKARLVAQGYNQQEGIDYDETYAPVARLESIRILLAYACALDFKLFQMDVKSAFLNGFINEEKFGLEESKQMKTPMSSDTKLMKDEECESVDSTKYRGMIGTAHLGLWYPKGTGIETLVYADSDHTGDYVDRKSTSGTCTFVGCCLTSWFLKKQTALVISTTEAEYVSTKKACQQALWMKQALIDYDVRLDDIPIMCDNKGVIDLSKNPVQHSRTKHIEIRHHFLHDNVQKGHILIEKVPSTDNIADILTKPLKRESFNYLRLMEHIP